MGPSPVRLPGWWVAFRDVHPQFLHLSLPRRGRQGSVAFPVLSLQQVRSCGAFVLLQMIDTVVWKFWEKQGILG